MTELFAGFGFSAPYLLVGIPLAVGLLVYAYLKRGRGDRKPVATILLLQKLKTTMAARKTFVPPPRFFFELLLLLLLGAAAAGMYRKGPDETIALLFDNSLSMMAQAGVGGELRLEVAKKDCRSFLGSVTERTRVAFYLTSPGLHLVREDLLTGDQALQVLDEVKSAYAPDALEAALGKLVQDGRYDRVVAWSDKGLAAPNTRLQLRNQITTGTGNIALQDLRSETRAEKGTVLVAEITSFAPREVQVRATFNGYNDVTGAFTAVKLGDQVVTVPPGGGKAVEFPTGSIHAAGYSVQLDVPGSAVGLNSLREDDTGYLATSAGSNHLTVVSTLSPAALGVQRLHAFDTAVVTPEQYAAAERHGGITIFHRTVPAALPEGSSLFVLPPPRTQLGGDLVQGQIEITHWAESHPIVNYLNVPLLELKSLVPLRKPDWAQELIASTAGTAAFVGEYHNHRYVGLGFEIFPFEGKREPVLSILLLNTLKWLSGATLSSGFEAAPFVIPAERGVTGARYVAGAQSGEIVLERNQRIAAVPGLVELSTPQAKVVQAIDLFDEDESNTLALRKVTIPDVVVRSDESQNQNQPLTNAILWAVLLLIAGDMIALLLVTRRQRGALAV